MKRSDKYIGLLLSLVLTAGAVTISAHVISHLQPDPGTCAICIQPPWSDDAVPVEPVHLTYPVSNDGPDHDPAVRIADRRPLKTRTSRAPPIQL